MRKAIVVVLLVVVAVPVLAEQRERSIGAMYDGLSALSCGQRRLAYSGYSREQQLALWTVHLQKFLASHPNLTSAQRAVVDEGLGMIASGALDRVEDPATTSVVQAFQERAQRQFDGDTFKEAFVRLGGRPVSAAGARLPGLVQTTLVPFCNCDQIEDCGGGPCNFFRPCWEVIACGPFGMDYCLGLCD
jgi:hypothetical protein